MIGRITGTVVYKNNPQIIVDVRDIGYLVFVPSPVFSSGTSIGDAITLYTHTHVREDLLELYGFTNPDDLQLFQSLISVSGVGCKTALTVFSVGSRSEIRQAIATGNVAFFTTVPRLGKKNAQKIIIELKNKLGGTASEDFVVTDETTHEVLAALASLGFHPLEAQKAVQAIRAEGTTTGEQVRLALQYLGGKKYE